jgi:hypothetical protein
VCISAQAKLGACLFGSQRMLLVSADSGSKLAVYMSQLGAKGSSLLELVRQSTGTSANLGRRTPMHLVAGISITVHDQLSKGPDTLICICCHVRGSCWHHAPSR